jgi:glycosyltransferase involved in cell wall biosynthesis
MATRDRVGVIPRAIESILGQSFEDFELIVVDDGSTDGTERLMQGLSDPRIRYVHQANAGLSMARNRGIASARGRFVTFLDDDDEALPTWLERFALVLADGPSGIVCCGALFVTEGVREGRPILPRKLGALYEHQEGLFRSGTYACRRLLLEDAGGFAQDALRSQNTELALRLIPACRNRGWVVRAVHEPLVVIHRHARPPDYFRAKFIGARHILARHADRLRANPKDHSRFWAIAGVNAFRMGAYGESRRSFVRAIRAHPALAKNYLRLAVSLTPPVGRRVWRPSRTVE